MPDSTAQITVTASDLASSVLEAVGTSLQGVTDAATSATGPLGEASGALDATGASAASAAETTSSAWGGLWESLSSGAVEGVSAIGESVEGLGEKITDGFENPMAAAGEIVSGFLEELGPFGVGLAAIGTAAAAVGAGLFELGEHAAEAGESVETFSLITGTNVDQVGALSAAATIAGGSLDGMQAMLVQMQRRLDATGPAADKFNAALADLGLNSDAFRAADPTDRIAMLATAMQNSAGSTNLMSDALAIMGRSGVSNIGMLMHYTDDARASGEALGYTWSDETTAAAVKLGEATRTTGVELATLTTTIGVVLLPALTSITTWVNDLIPHLENAAPEIALLIGAAFGPVGLAVAGLADLAIGLDVYANKAAMAAQASEIFGAQTDQANRFWAQAAAAGMSAGDAAYFVAASMQAAGQSTQTASEQSGIAVDELNAIAKALKGAASAGDAYTALWDRIAEAEANAGHVDAALTASQQGLIDHYRLLGLSVQEIATAMSLSTGQVTAAEAAHTKAATAAATHQAAIDKLTQAIVGDAKSVNDQVDAIRAAIAIGSTDQNVIADTVAAITKLTTSHTQLSVAMKGSIADLTSYAEWNRTIQGSLDLSRTKLNELAGAGTTTDAVLGAMTGRLSDNAAALKDIENGIPAPLVSYTTFDGVLQKTGAHVQVVLNELGQLPAVTAQATQAIKDATAATKSWSDAFGQQLDGQLEKLPQVFEQAFSSSGGIATALTKEAQQLGATFGKDLVSSINSAISSDASLINSATLGSAAGLGLASGIAIASNSATDLKTKITEVGEAAAATATAVLVASAATAAGITGAAVAGAVALGAVTAGVGLAVVGVYALYEAFKSASQGELDARTAFTTWETAADTTFASIGSAADQAIAGTNKLTQATELVQEAYTALGINGADAAQDMQVALDATHNSAQAVAAATANMTTAIQIYAQELPLAQAGQTAVNAQLTKLTTITPTIKTDLTNLYDAQNINQYVIAIQKLNGDLTQQTTDATNLASAMATYNVTWGQLKGAAAEGLEDTAAQGLLTDFQSLAASGLSINDEMKAMGPNISSFVQQAQQAGVQVPAAMQSIIQSAIDAGQLFDANGNAITNMTQLGLTFGTDMTDNLNNVATATSTVATSLQNDLAGGFVNATNAAQASQTTNTSTTDQLTQGLTTANQAVTTISSGFSTTLPASAQAGIQKVNQYLATIPTSIPITLDYHTEGAPAGTPTATAAMGGLVTSTGVSQYMAGGGLVLPFAGGPRGTDTVPIWATPGERVLSRDENQAFTGGRATSTQAMEDKLDRLHTATTRQTEQLASMVASLPMMLRHALRGR